MRPSTIITLIAGVLVGLGSLALAAWSLIDRDGGMFWFYWIAPLLVLGVGGMLVSLALGYWEKVGKLEVKGRPKSE